MPEDITLPIPPGCPYFEGQTFWIMPDGKWPKDTRGEMGIPLDSGDASIQGWRPLVAATARCAWLDMPMPTEQEWEEGTGLVPVYKVWLQAKDLTRHLTHKNGRCGATWDAFCDHMALRCQQWGRQA